MYDRTLQNLLGQGCNKEKLRDEPDPVTVRCLKREIIEMIALVGGHMQVLCKQTPWQRRTLKVGVGKNDPRLVEA